MDLFFLINAFAFVLLLNISQQMINVQTTKEALRFFSPVQPDMTSKIAKTKVLLLTIEW